MHTLPQRPRLHTLPQRPCLWMGGLASRGPWQRSQHWAWYTPLVRWPVAALAISTTVSSLLAPGTLFAAANYKTPGIYGRICTLFAITWACDFETRVAQRLVAAGDCGAASWFCHLGGKGELFRRSAFEVQYTKRAFPTLCVVVRYMQRAPPSLCVGPNSSYLESFSE